MIDESQKGDKRSGSRKKDSSSKRFNHPDNVVITKKNTFKGGSKRSPLPLRTKDMNLSQVVTRDSTAQTALELEIIYACDMLLQELAGPPTNKRQTLI